MKMINYLRVGCILILALTIDVVQPTCVLDSDFGFKINCAFKKAGLFRVRNLGGVKAHASIGFSLGDELGFEQSLTNLDPSRRRSVNIKNGSPVNQLTESTSKPDGKQEKRGKQNRIMMRPPPPTNTRMHPSAVERLNSLHRRASTSMPPIIVSDATLTRVTPTSQYTMGVPPFKPLPPKEETLKVLPISTTRKTYSPLPIPQSKGPGIAYQSEKIRNYDTTIRTITQPFKSGLYRITPSPIDNTQFQIHTTLHPFLPMPQALKIIPGPIFKDSVQLPLAPDMRTKTPTAYSFTQNTVAIHRPDPISNFVDPVPQQVHQIANQNYPYGTKKVDDYNTITGYNDDTALKINKEDINDKIAEIAKQGNISMEAVEAAIALRQQQLLSKYANIQFPTTTSSTTTTTTTTTTTPRTLAPVLFEPDPTPEEIIVPQTPKPKRQPTIGKVMNAPKEYYPVGYEKNFDDHFQSKVDLPDTDFHCGDQKYFPGLYGDENLGCMVFHVCALTDDGLVMKSFLCPESTLFDQTILKCNWWFYVDCKSTRRLYDTNIPVSKSYQLMKALTFFSSYNKDNAEDIAQNANPEDMDGVKQAISILENHDKTPSTIHIVTPQPAVNNEAPVYRGNRNMRNSTTIKIIQNDMKTSSSEIKTDVRNSSTIKQSKSQTEVKAENKTSAEKTNSSENNSKERQYRRRQMWNKSKSKNNFTTTIPTTPKEEIKEISQEPYISSTEGNKIKQMILLDEEKQRKKVLEEQMKIIEERNKFVEEQNKVVKLTDQIETANETISQEVIRVSRSSAEIDKDGDHKIGNHKVREEKVFIVRPTLVGEVSTPTAAIEKLDEAILGRRRKKQIPILNVVTPEIQESRT